MLGAATRANGAADVLITDVDAVSVLGNGTAHRNVLIVAQDDGEAVIRKAMQKGVRGSSCIPAQPMSSSQRSEQ